MTTYKSHNNPLVVHCAECHDDITLKGQTIYDDRVLCDVCIEEKEDTVTYYEE